MACLQNEVRGGRGRQWAFKLMFILLTVASLEVVARLAFRHLLPPSFNQVRSALAGNKRFQPGYQKTTGQAYLLYVPTPKLNIDGQEDHNRHGYRGVSIPMDRTPGIYRILCLGGSTTYGWSVPLAQSAYPAQLERLLNENPPEGYTSVEVMNGGAPYATSAEMLTAYHFKFHYYKPDLVILNEGGNDAQGMIEPNYHPDYSNWRQSPTPLRPLPPVGRALVHSRLIALVLVPLLHGMQPSEPTFLRDSSIPPTAPWYPRATSKKSLLHMQEVPLAEYAFAHNISTLIREILNDGSKVVLMPFREAPVHEIPPGELETIAFNRKLFEEYAAKFNTGFAPFPAEAISPENWTDSCHLNEAGEQQKARHLLPYVQETIAD